jgi:agmatine deiminase
MTIQESLPETLGMKPRICAEWEPHSACLMAWPWRVDIWGHLLPAIQRDIECLARTIAEYEPVVMLVPMSSERHPRHGSWPEMVSFLPFEYDDIWVRDTGPIWLSDGSALMPRFNAWGRKKLGTYPIPHERDATLAERLCVRKGIPTVDLGLVVEGGAIESDGRGNLVLTRSNMLQARRNGRISENTVEAMFKCKLDANIIWLPGSTSRYDFTDGHVDAIARYTPDGSLLYDKIEETAACAAGTEYAAVRRNAGAMKAMGTALCRPRGHYARAFETFSYTNFYVAENVVVMPRFKKISPAERRIYKIVEKAYGRAVVPVSLPALFSSGGGGVHCVVREVPRWA